MSRHLLAPMPSISEVFTETRLNDPISEVYITKYQQLTRIHIGGLDVMFSESRSYRTIYLFSFRNFLRIDPFPLQLLFTLNCNLKAVL